MEIFRTLYAQPGQRDRRLGVGCVPRFGEHRCMVTRQKGNTENGCRGTHPRARGAGSSTATRVGRGPSGPCAGSTWTEGAGAGRRPCSGRGRPGAAAACPAPCGSRPRCATRESRASRGVKTPPAGWPLSSGRRHCHVAVVGEAPART